MLKSPNLKFNLIVQNQAQKEITVNEALIKIDALLNNAVISMSIASPPNNPEDGALYIVAEKATGHWQNHDHELAYFYATNWYFITPKIGCSLWVIEKNKTSTYTQNGWE